MYTSYLFKAKGNNSINKLFHQQKQSGEKKRKQVKIWHAQIYKIKADLFKEPSLALLIT